MGVFGDYALKYLEQGYVVFPVIGKGGHGKTPYEWNKLTAKIVNDGKFNKGFLRSPQVTDAATNLIIEQSIHLNYDDCNIALLCGEVSGVIGFDIDTDDPQIVSLINQFIPQSRCVKRGSKGETRFFKYTKEFFENERKGIYDLLSNGSYSVMPPSIHPDTKEAYVELGESLYYLSPDDLSCIDAKKYEKLKNIIDGITGYKGEGRDNRLSRIGFAMACRGEPLELIAEELLKVDLTHHKSDPNGCFFQDTKETKVRGKTPEQAATAFAKRCIQDATKKGLIKVAKTGALEVQHVFYEEPKILQIPKTTRFIDETAMLFSACDKSNTFGITQLHIMSIVAAIAANKIAIQDRFFSTPRMYGLALAKPGGNKTESTRLGKKALKKFISLVNENISNNGQFEIPSEYTGRAAFLKEVFVNPQGYLFKDEAKDDLEQMTTAEGNKRDMPRAFTDLWSQAGDIFEEKSAVTEESKRAAIACPAITMFLMTQRDTIVNTDQVHDLYGSGFLARFYLATDTGYKEKEVLEFKTHQEECEYLYKVVNDCSIHFYNMHQGCGNFPFAFKPTENKYHPTQIYFSDAIYKFLKDVKRREEQICADLEYQQYLSFDFAKRFTEHVRNVLLIFIASELAYGNKIDRSKKLMFDDLSLVEKAYQWVSYQYDLHYQTFGQLTFPALEQKIFECIRDSKEKGRNLRQMATSNKFKGRVKYNIKQIRSGCDILLEMGVISRRIDDPSIFILPNYL